MNERWIPVRKRFVEWFSVPWFRYIPRFLLIAFDLPIAAALVIGVGTVISIVTLIVNPGMKFSLPNPDEEPRSYRDKLARRAHPEEYKKPILMRDWTIDDTGELYGIFLALLTIPSGVFWYNLYTWLTKP